MVIMVRCSNCGKDNPEKQNTCFWCGTELFGAGISETKKLPFASEKSEAPEMRKQASSAGGVPEITKPTPSTEGKLPKLDWVEEKGSWGLKLAVVIFVVAIVGIGWYFLTAYGKEVLTNGGTSNLITRDPAEMSLTLADFPTGWKKIEGTYFNLDNLYSQSRGLFNKQDLASWGYETGYRAVYDKPAENVGYLIRTLKFSKIDGAQNCFDIYHSLYDAILENMHENVVTYQADIGDRSEKHHYDFKYLPYEGWWIYFRKTNVVVSISLSGPCGSVSEAEIQAYAEIIESRIA
jgi:hypothetical protein